MSGAAFLSAGRVAHLTSSGVGYTVREVSNRLGGQEMATRGKVQVSVYDTPTEVFETLSRVYKVQHAENATWIEFTDADGVVLIFFATDETTEPTTLHVPA